MTARYAVVISGVIVSGLAPASAARADSTLTGQLGALVARPGGLTADVVAARTVATSPELRRRHLDEEAAEDGVDEALVAYFPRLALTFRYAKLSSIAAPVIGNLVVAPESPTGPLAPGSVLVNTPISFPSINKQILWQASVDVPLSDYVLRIPQAQSAVEAGQEAARWNQEATRLQLAADARVSYYNWARARLQVVVAEQALLQAQSHRDSAQNLFKVGNASRADVMHVEAQVAASELFVTRARDLEIVLRDQMQTGMHDPDDSHYEIGEDLQAVLPPLEVGGVPQLLAEAWGSRRELKVLEETRKQLDSQADVTRAGIFPRVDLFFDVIDADPNQRFFPQRDQFDATWDVGIAVTWTVNDTATNVYATHAARTREASVREQMAGVRDALRNEVVQASQGLHEADFAVDSTTRQLDAAEESYRARKELFNYGRATSTELTDAETDLTQARLNAVGARIDQRVAHVRLLHAVGRDAAEPATPASQRSEP